MAKELQLPFLGQIPIDARLAQACDEGNDFFEKYPESATASAYLQIAKGEWYFLILKHNQQYIRLVFPSAFPLPNSYFYKIISAITGQIEKIN